MCGTNSRVAAIRACLQGDLNPAGGFSSLRRRRLGLALAWFYRRRAIIGGLAALHEGYIRQSVLIAAPLIIVPMSRDEMRALRSRRRLPLAMESVVHVVEDDRPMRDSLVELLEDAGYAVHAYGRAEELLARGAAIEPGCVVSDVRMPGMDGLTLLRRLRASGSELPLILITAHGDVAMAVRAMRAGAVS